MKVFIQQKKNDKNLVDAEISALLKLKASIIEPHSVKFSITLQTIL